MAACSAWVQQTEGRAFDRQERLESELNGYKTNLLKEAIRVGHTDLADFHFSRGDMQVPATATDLNDVLFCSHAGTIQC